MCWKIEYIISIILSTLVDYAAGIQIAKSKIKTKRKEYLILSLVINLGILFLFKYFNFFNDSLRLAFNRFNIFYGLSDLKVLLPIGISFYTFQTLSYTIDVYRGKKEPERHLGIFALYVAFFLQLVAGTIERSTHLLSQFHKKFNFDYKRVTDGLKLMLWGLFQKVVIADRLAIAVDRVYNDPTSTIKISRLYFTNSWRIILRLFKLFAPLKPLFITSNIPSLFLFKWYPSLDGHVWLSDDSIPKVVELPTQNILTRSFLSSGLNSLPLKPSEFIV